MNIDLYQDLAKRTANLNNGDRKNRLTNWAMGLSGETGELIDHLKKHVHHGHDLDVEYVKKELGDVMWYWSSIASDLDLKGSDILERNISKLRNRYPDGFSKERSRNRKEGDNCEVFLTQDEHSEFL